VGKIAFDFAHANDDKRLHVGTARAALFGYRYPIDDLK
jgi:arginyl-tRNA synthetase